MMPQDAQAVAEIEQAIFSRPWSRQGFLDSLASPDTLFLVALEDGETCDFDRDADQCASWGMNEAINCGDNPDKNSGGSDDGNRNVPPVIAGYIGMYQAIDEGEITNVAVFEPYRKRGIGRALLKALAAGAGARGVSRIVLEVRVSNHPAIALYEQMGFRKIGTRKGFYDFPKEDADIMELHIGENEG
jgi:ribosomal-protein-alanine N-acetyltransferase